MSVAELVGKFGELEVSGVSPVANDIAAKVSSEGVPSLEKNNLMADLKVRTPAPLSLAAQPMPVACSRHLRRQAA